MGDPADPLNSGTLTLADIRKELPPSHWRHSREFEDVGVALANGLTPHLFWAMEIPDQAIMIAYQRVHATMEAYEHHLSEQHQNRRRPGRKERK